MTQPSTQPRQTPIPQQLPLDLCPVGYDDLQVVIGQDRVVVLCRGVCFCTFDVTDRFARNYCMVQLHLAGQIKLKNLARLFGLSIQHCSNLVCRYRDRGVEGLFEHTAKRVRNRTKIDARIGELVVALREQGKPYKEICQAIRFRYHKVILPQSVRAWIYKRNKRLAANECNEAEQLDLYPIAMTDEHVAADGQWRWNSYAGSMLLYSMIHWSGFLKPFEEYIVEDEQTKHSRCGVRRVLLTLYFLHALRCKSIEQSKHLIGDDFKEIVGGDFLRVQGLRYAVDDVVQHPGFEQAMAMHYQTLIDLGATGDPFLYTDGHFSSYYGKQKVPKGYDPRRQMPGRGRNTIFLHNTQGEIIYLKESPTNTTLAKDIETLVDDIEGLGMPVSGKTLIFDRGGYSRNCFRYLQARGMCFVTYLKHRKKERQIATNRFRSYAIVTDEGEPIRYQLFEKQVRETHYGMIRTIMFLAEDGRQIPIITSHPSLPMVEVVYLLQRRWREENCFKYMIEHFGIDLLTTYKPQEAPDKTIERVNPERRQLNRRVAEKKRELETLHSQLAKVLRAEEDKQHETIQTFLKTQHALEFSIKNTQVDLDSLLRQRDTVSPKIRVNLKDEHVIIAQKRRLLINAVKAINYNSEKWLQRHVKRHHPKSDETLSLLRSLWRQPGRIRHTARRVDVELQALDVAPMRATLDAVLRDLKENNQLRLPDGRLLHINQVDKI